MNAAICLDDEALSSSLAEIEEVSMITLVEPFIPSFSYSSIKSHPSFSGIFRSRKITSGRSSVSFVLLKNSIAFVTLLMDSTSSANLACLIITELMELTISSSSTSKTFLNFSKVSDGLH